MNNIFRIFLSDWRRLGKNVVGVVIVIGLVVLPSLYAWFNIISNWDPYGEDATSLMHVAVYSEDKGTDLSGLKLNVGDTIVKNLEANDTIGWVFTKSADEAVEGVKSGEYYAAMVITEDFTENLMSFISGIPENPVIKFYENDKKNAIATKITSKVETTIKNEIGSSFVGTLGQYISEAENAFFGESGIADKITENAVNRIGDVGNDLDSLIVLLTAFKTLGASSSGTLESVQGIIPALNTSVDTAKSEVELINGGLKTANDSVSSIQSLIDGGIDTFVSEVDSLNSQAALMTVNIDNDHIAAICESFREQGDATFKILTKFISKENKHLKKAEHHYSKIVEALENYKAIAQNVTDLAGELRTKLDNESYELKSALYSAKAVFDAKASNEIAGAIEKMSSAVAEAQDTLDKAGSNLPEISSEISGLKEKIDNGTASVDETIEYVDDLKESLSKLVKKIEKITDSQAYENLESLVSSNPDTVLEFLKSPVQLKEEKFFEIETYGSAMAPFYTVLAIWIGALILVALLKVKVKNEPEFELYDMKPYQKFFGRYLTIFFLGQAQTLLCVLGDLIYIGIQCRHPFLYVIGSMVISFCFTALMYSLTVAFGNIGQAAAVIVLVLQVAGSGGTFPVQVLPVLYRSIYKVLPFTYAIDALRECVGGLYGNDFLIDLLYLGIFLAAAFLIVIILGKPFKFLNRKIEESKSKSGIML